MRHAGLQRLATGPWGAVVWLGISLAKSVRSRQPTRIYRDADGDWVQSTPRAAIAVPSSTSSDSNRSSSPRVFRCLQKTVRVNGLSNVIMVSCAAHSSDGEVRISDDEFYAASTVLDAAPGERIPARSLGSLFDELGIQQVDLLKMNIEGAEVDALAGMASHRYAVRNVAISCHDFLAARGGSQKFRTRSRVVALLEQSGFQMLPSLDDAPEDWARDYVYATRSQQWEPV
jgi:FkbM family methyltransferase